MNLTIFRNFNFGFLYPIALFIFLAFKFYFLFSPEQLVGWDTPGHYILNQEFSNLAKKSLAVDWSNVWFGGFPIFLFYPPMFYYLSHIISVVLNINNIHSMNIAILLTIFLLANSIILFGKEFIYSKYKPKAIWLFSGISLFFYFSYGGDGLQATSLVGIVEGTFISSFAHSLLLYCFISFEKFRKSGKLYYLVFFTFFVSFLFYTHLLTTVFFLIGFFIYLYIYIKDFLYKKIQILASIIFIVLLILPLLWGFFKYSQFTSGVSYSSAYPPLLSILGKEVFEKALALNSENNSLLMSYILELISSYRIIYLISLVLIASSIKNLIKSKSLTFILAITGFFLWFSLDHSIGFLTQNLKIHNYRGFDTFFIFLSLLLPTSIGFMIQKFSLKRYRNFIYFVFFFILFSIFINFNPFQYQGYQSPFLVENFSDIDKSKYNNLRTAFANLPKESLVQAEIVRSKEHFKSPHMIQTILYESGLRNNLGLTVESAIYPTLLFNWQEFGFKNNFRWGTDSSDRFLMLHLNGNMNSPNQYLSFIERSGVEYLFGFTQEFHQFINSFPDKLELVYSDFPYKIYKIRNLGRYTQNLPIGVVFLNQSENNENKKNSFLKLTNLLQVKLVAEGKKVRFIYLPESKFRESNNLDKLFSRMLIINSDQDNSFLISHLSKNKIGYFHLTDMNSDQNVIEGCEKFSEFYKQIERDILKEKYGNWRDLNYNYFSEFFNECTSCYTNDTGRLSIFTEQGSNESKYPNANFNQFGTIYYYFLSFVFWGLIVLIFVSKIPYFAFSYFKIKFSLSIFKNWKQKS